VLCLWSLSGSILWGGEARPLCLRASVVSTAQEIRAHITWQREWTVYILLVSPGGLSSWPRLRARAQGKQSPGLHHLQRAGPWRRRLARGDVWRSLCSSWCRPILARRACDGHTKPLLLGGMCGVCGGERGWVWKCQGFPGHPSNHWLLTHHALRIPPPACCTSPSLPLTDPSLPPSYTTLFYK